ncbi:glycine-rich cell wall structural protein 2-like [Anoplophora glabripennis]|uniref:glycine-rich cell wall structural protein 2-like n=1 Tax=Anoplophora glabripennis TaxID=217634 RepID=UPI000873ABD1|nr:glycine-rich cell wall structural protein 2-like [Anoplophora glabripennis]
MNLLSTTVLLLLSIFSYANSESHGTSVVMPKKIGSVYLVPVFVPNQEEYVNSAELLGNPDNYREPTPLQRVVLGYTPRGAQYANTDFEQTSSTHESVLGRQKRSPGGGRGGGGGGGGGGGRGGSGSWSQSSSSSSSGSWGGGSGSGRGGGGGKGKGHGK